MLINVGFPEELRGFIFLEDPGPVAGPTGAFRTCQTANWTAGASASIAADTVASAASTFINKAPIPIASTLPIARAARNAGNNGRIAFLIAVSITESALVNVCRIGMD